MKTIKIMVPTPLNPKNEGLEDEFPVQTGEMQVPISIFRAQLSVQPTQDPFLFAGRIFATRPMVCPYTCSADVSDPRDENFGGPFFQTRKKKTC